MKKNLLLVLLCFILILGMAGCGKEKENSNIKKNYCLEEINIDDCNLENITYLSNVRLISNGKIYVYSNKKYSETDNHCKLLSVEDPNKIYHYVGSTYNWGSLFTTDGNDLYFFYYSPSDLDPDNGKLKKVESLNENDKKILNQYKENNFYYHKYGFNVTDEKIQPSENENSLDYPKNEKVLYAIDKYAKYIITDKKQYYIGVDKNDKCYEYNDVKCTYKLIESHYFDDILNDFKDNISFFDGEYLATKDNKLYRVRMDEDPDNVYMGG